MPEALEILGGRLRQKHLKALIEGQHFLVLRGRMTKQFRLFLILSVTFGGSFWRRLEQTGNGEETRNGRTQDDRPIDLGFHFFMKSERLKPNPALAPLPPV